MSADAGLIEPFYYRDPTTGHEVTVRTSERYTILSAEGKEFFFLRENGHLDGYGRMAIGEHVDEH